MEPRPSSEPALQPIFDALLFAAKKHRDQRRKDADASPYINHPIEVAALLARAGVSDPVLLRAAILHDTIEDTQTTADELDRAFGAEVRRVVEEVTDDKSLPKAERKRLQVEHAPHLSERARQVKIADKISNVRAIAEEPPKDWSWERRWEYLDWADRVVAGCRGLNAALESIYDEIVAEGRRVLCDERRSSAAGAPGESAP